MDGGSAAIVLFSRNFLIIFGFFIKRRRKNSMLKDVQRRIFPWIQNGVMYSHHLTVRLRFGMDMMYDGLRWIIVTFSAVLASAGTSVIVVAPLPMTATRLFA